MMKASIISIFLLILSTTCIDAPRDNMYDPENPDRAYLSAFVYELGFYPLDAAVVLLTQNSTIVQSDTSDHGGTIEFEEITPGIYDIYAEALYYSTATYPPEGLWAGVYIESLRIELNTLDFEDETLGTSSPHKFEPLTGSWIITEDIQQVETHSVPQVYRGSDSAANDIAISLCRTEAESFLFEANIKVDTSSGNNWRAGFVIRYQDVDNYYIVTISPDTVYCDLVMNGQKTNIHAKVQASIPGVWQKLRMERPAGWIFIRFSLNNALLFSVYDDILSSGRLGLFAYNEEKPAITTAYFDDVTLDLTYDPPE